MLEKEGASEGMVEGWWLTNHGSCNDHNALTVETTIENAEWRRAQKDNPRDCEAICMAL